MDAIDSVHKDAPGTSLEEKIDRILDLMGEEVNIHPDTLRSGALVAQSWSLTTNSAIPLLAEVWVNDHPDGRYLHLRLKAPDYLIVKDLRWKCVFRDPGGMWPTVERPT